MPLPVPSAAPLPFRELAAQHAALPPLHPQPRINLHAAMEEA